MKKCIVFFLLVLGFSPLAFSQSPFPKVDPATQGFSVERLARIDTNINKWIDSKWMNGAVVLITSDGKTVYEKGFGYDNLQQKTPLQPSMLFRLASQTKAVTSVGIMILYEEGKLMLDDTIGKYVPEFSNIQVLDNFNDADSSYTTVNARRPITLRDLLTHTSGIGYAQIGSKAANAIYAKNNITAGLGIRNGQVIGDAMKRLGKLPLMHQPGERFTYGLNTDLLGYIIEVVSGMPLDRFLTTRIFRPLGMNDTYFYLPADKHKRLTTLSMDDDQGVHPMGANYSFQGSQMNPAYPTTTGTYFSGGAGLTSTISDYAIFLNMLLNGGSYNGKQILAPTSVRMMTTNQINALNVGSDKFGLGFSIATEQSATREPVSVGTFGWGGAFGTAYWVDPKQKLTIQFYTQIWGRRHNVEDQVLALVYQALVKGAK